LLLGRVSSLPLAWMRKVSKFMCGGCIIIRILVDNIIKKLVIV
jgi:hypothetical protein